MEQEQGRPSTDIEHAGNSNESSRPWLVPHRFKPGKSGNPSGRPKGKLTNKLRTVLAMKDPETGRSNAQILIEEIVKRATKKSDTLALEIFDRIDGPKEQAASASDGKVQVLIVNNAYRPPWEKQAEEDFKANGNGHS